MGRIAGDKGQVYFDVAGGGQASPLPFMAKWKISFKTDRYDQTAMGDKNKVRTQGLPDATGDFSGHYDDATAQTYTAAVDGAGRKWYLYPNRNTPGQYFFGMINADYEVDGGTGTGVSVACSWDAADVIQKVG
jgi:hypothetical protein